MSNEHGTAYWYRSKKCRCEKCKGWKREQSRKERAARSPTIPDGLVLTGAAYAAAGGRRALERLERNGLVSPRMAYGSKRYWSVTDIEAAVQDERKRIRESRFCSIDGCSGVVTARNLCQTHYNKIRYSELGQSHRKVTPSQNAKHRLASGGTLHPPLSLPYRAIARSCRGCGELITTPDDLIRRSAGEIPPCRTCHVKKVVEYQKRRRAEDEEYRGRELTRGRDMSSRHSKKKQVRSLAGASRRGLQWTGPELEMVMRSDLTVEQIAKAIGRTFAATAHARHRAKTDPKFIALAGLSQSLDQE